MSHQEVGNEDTDDCGGLELSKTQSPNALPSCKIILMLGNSKISKTQSSSSYVITQGREVQGREMELENPQVWENVIAK